MTMTEQHIDERLISVLEKVSDPEIPVLSIMDMGVVNSRSEHFSPNLRHAHILKRHRMLANFQPTLSVLDRWSAEFRTDPGIPLVVC